MRILWRYRESKKQIKKHVCRVLYMNRKYLTKKNRFDEREYADKLYQQCFNEKIKSAKYQKIIYKNKNLSERCDYIYKYLWSNDLNSQWRRTWARFHSNFLCIFESILKRYCKIIVNNEDEFSRRLNDADMTFRNQFWKNHNLIPWKFF